jgi:hypothetical protein
MVAQGNVNEINFCYHNETKIYIIISFDLNALIMQYCWVNDMVPHIYPS